MKASFKTFVNAILSGIYIGIAGTVFLAVPDKIVGAVLFGFGLMTICCYGFKLYTGAIGYLVNQGRETLSYLWTLLLIWLGNFVGTFFVGTVFRSTRAFTETFATRVTGICQDKLNDGFVSILILSFFCGVLMYMAVNTYRREDLAPVFRFASVFLCVTIFILCGFEHCIANMYYFSVADMWSGKTLGYVLMMTLGNSLGGWMLPLFDKIRQ